MNEKELAEIKEMAKGATPGPWESCDDRGKWGDVWVGGRHPETKPGRLQLICKVNTSEVADLPPIIDKSMGMSKSLGCGGRALANMELVAAAPDLLAEVARLRAWIGYIREKDAFDWIDDADWDGALGGLPVPPLKYAEPGN
jgi:hypothetical protein